MCSPGKEPTESVRKEEPKLERLLDEPSVYHTDLLLTVCPARGFLIA